MLRDFDANITVVSSFLVETIGITEEVFRAYEQLQLSALSVPVTCRVSVHWLLC